MREFPALGRSTASVQKPAANHCCIDRAPNIYHQIEEPAVMIPNPIPAPHVDLSFPHRWQAEVLAARPLILPPRHFVYPQAAEEVERGALEVLVRLEAGPDAQSDGSDAQPFLATCALGFRDPAAPSGLWSTPRPEEICAVAGGYAYLIDTTRPERFAMVPYRPVLEIRPMVRESLLLFVGHHSILAWGRDGMAWESTKLSDEGVTITGSDGGILRGTGWDMMSDREKPFALELRSGMRLPIEHSE
jgi:hypothetical protein